MALHNMNQTQNLRGEWVPAIPLPLYGFALVECGAHIGMGAQRCGMRFNHLPTERGRKRALRRYREHYALVHVMGLE